MSEAPCAPEPPAPTREQEGAIAARDRDVLLEAGAGTGKTRVLVERYCDALTEDGARIEQILAFTFTERAAAELRHRIRKELGRRACVSKRAGEPGRAAELRRVARDTDRAFVSTMHGFCRRLLAAHPAAAGLDPAFRVMDEAEAVRVRGRAAREAVDSLLADGDEEVARTAAAYRWRLGEMAVAIHERLRSLGQVSPTLPPAPDPAHGSKGSGEGEPLSLAEGEAARAAHHALATVLERFGRRYEELKGARAGLDFADLELRALELLRREGPVANAWRGRFAHIMVDEFQDTNRVQLDLVEALRGPETRVFRVGDEHQSIYRFRNADLEVFRGERARAEADPRTEVLPLRGNFRSAASVLGAVNLVGRALLPDFVELTAGRAVAAGAPTEVLLTLDEGRARDARNWKQEGIGLDAPPSETTPAIVAEARFLARRLRELVDAGEVEAGDIVVLLRAFTHVDAYEEALRRAGLDPYVVGGRGYWTQQQVEDAIRLCGVVANPLDDEMLLGALASPACSVSPDALWLLRKAASDDDDRAWHIWPVVRWRYGGGDPPPHPVAERWLEQVPAADAERLAGFCATLRELRAEAPLRPLDELVERTLTAFGYDLVLLSAPGGRARMANVRKLIRLAREFEEHEGRDLRAFLAAAAESTRRDEREGMAPVQAEDHDGVRIMTVHAAKGLEFPVVAVPDLGRALAAGSRSGDVAIAPPVPGEDLSTSRFGMRLVFPAAPPFGLWELDSLLREDRVAEAAEGCRLVYVAASRAQDRLILSGVFKPQQAEPPDDPRPSDAPLRRLLPALRALGWDGATHTLLAPPPTALDGHGSLLADVEISIRLNEPSAERAEWLRERLGPRATQSVDDAADAPPPLLEPLSAPASAGHLSYSALADYERCGYRFYAERVLGLTEPAPAEASAPAVARARRLGFGNAVHAALEWSARHGWARPDDRLLARLLVHEGLTSDSELLERARTLVRAWLDSPLRGELEGWRARPETPFAVMIGTSVVRGKIDLLATTDSEATVVDFKTDELAGSSAAELGERYAIQRATYAVAVSEALPGLRVRAIHCFLEAADEPVVEELDRRGLDGARARLEELVAMIMRGSFEPPADPYPALCYGCPAAARLCPRPAWQPPVAARPQQLVLVP